MPRSSAEPLTITPESRTILFVTVFIHLLGFGIIIPLLPYYAETYGATGITVGLLTTSFSFCQFLFAPVWGRLSDRIGRRPVLVASLLVTGISYLIYAAAHSLAVLFLSRMLAGVAGAAGGGAAAGVRAGGVAAGAKVGVGVVTGAHVGGVRLFPLSTLPQTFTDLDPNQQYYLHCKSGVRSLKAVKFLQEQGFKYAKSVKGGISAWSDEIDHSVAKY